MQWILHLQMEGTSPRHEGHWDLHGSGLYDPPLRERKRVERSSNQDVGSKLGKHKTKV